MRASKISFLAPAILAFLACAAGGISLAHAGPGAASTGSGVGICSGGGCVEVSPCVSGTTLCPPFPDHPAYDPNIEFRKGAAALRASDYKEAKREFAKVLYMAPTNSDVLFAMGVAEVGLGDVNAGAQAFTHALHWNPKHIDSARELAIADLKLGRSDKADAQLAALKTRAAKCAGACKDASDLQGAIDAIERASNRLTAPPAPASPSGGS